MQKRYAGFYNTEQQRCNLHMADVWLFAGIWGDDIEPHYLQLTV
jgi:hypothetical protein